MVLVFATLAGMKSVLGASDGGRDQAEDVREHLPRSWKQMPCAKTSTDALARLDRQQITAQCRDGFVRNEAESRCGTEPSRLAGQAERQAVDVASDGKVLKGTGTQVDGGEKPQKQVVPVYDVHTGSGVHHCPSAEKQKEVSALTPLVTEVVCRTADAAHSSHECGRRVTRAGGDGMLIVKDHTPLTRADLELFCEDPQADRSIWQADEQVENGHGRLERRQVLTTPDLNE